MRKKTSGWPRPYWPSASRSPPFSVVHAATEPRSPPRRAHELRRVEPVLPDHLLEPGPPYITPQRRRLLPRVAAVFFDSDDCCCY